MVKGDIKKLEKRIARFVRNDEFYDTSM